jgi:hypothetical protein
MASSQKKQATISSFFSKKIANETVSSTVSSICSTSFEPTSDNQGEIASIESTHYHGVDQDSDQEFQNEKEGRLSFMDALQLWSRFFAFL